MRGADVRARELRSGPAMTIGEERTPAPSPHTPFAISRNLNFWIFPVLVFGSSVNTT